MSTETKLSLQSDNIRKLFVEKLKNDPLRVISVEETLNEVYFSLGGYKFVFHWQIFPSLKNCVFVTNEVNRETPLSGKKVYSLIFSMSIYSNDVCFAVNGEWIPITILLSEYKERLIKYIGEKCPDEDINKLLTNMPKHPKEN